MLFAFLFAFYRQIRERGTNLLLLEALGFKKFNAILFLICFFITILQ